MALFLYGFDITQFNRFVNFKKVGGGAELTATLTIGNYTATSLMTELKKQMELIDGVNTYTWSINRSVNSGITNRVTVSTSGSYLSILFGTGTNAANSPFTMIGFAGSDLTGALTYTSISNCGTILIPEFPIQDYLPPDAYVNQDGSKNISAAGIKETLVFAQMQFIQGQWKWITNFSNRTQYTEWVSFLKYATKQLKFEFTPSIYESTDVFYQVTLETTAADNNGMGYKLTQMRGDGLYRFYDTGVMKFRVIPT